MSVERIKKMKQRETEEEISVEDEESDQDFTPPPPPTSLMRHTPVLSISIKLTIIPLRKVP